MYFFNTIEIHKIKIAKHVYFWWETLILYYDDIYTCFVVLLTWAIFQEVEQKKKVCCERHAKGLVLHATALA